MTTKAAFVKAAKAWAKAHKLDVSFQESEKGERWPFLTATFKRGKRYIMMDRYNIRMGGAYAPSWSYTE
jgi:hypothetical protein